MKMIHSIVGIFIIIVGCTIMSITVDDEQLHTLVLKIGGVFVLFVGVYYVKRIAKLGKQ